MNPPQEPLLMPISRPEFHEKIADLILLDTSLEKIIFGWCGKEQHIVISNFPDAPFPAVGVTFLLKEEPIFIAALPNQELLARCADFKKIDETVLRFSDQPGFRPNDEWYEERNARLGVYYNEDLQEEIAPAQAISELILGYILSSLGYAEVGAQTIKKGAQVCEGYSLTLVYVGSTDAAADTGWMEEFYVFEDDLAKRCRKGAGVLEII